MWSTARPRPRIAVLGGRLRRLRPIRSQFAHPPHRPSCIPATESVGSKRE
jgi:hypothetical protein